VKIRFLRKDERVLPEMGAKAHFLRDAPGDTASGGTSILAVDGRAVVRTTTGPAVFVLEGTKARLVPVQTGRQVGALVEIAGGVAAGTKVIVNPPEKLSTGSEVRARE
jgi:hypothetical protein